MQNNKDNKSTEAYINLIIKERLLLYSKRLIHFFWLVIIMSCASNRFTPRTISELVLVDSLVVYQQFDKVSFLPSERTFFCLLQSENSIYIYKNDVFYNKIGGSGFSSDNFRNLSDITIGIDGYLYALDSFDKSIKRFDRDGKFQNSVSISHINSPIKFAFSYFGYIFIYDSHAKEVHSLDSFNFSTKFTFGKFQLYDVDNLFVCGDFLNIYDNRKKQTNIYLINGKFENDYRDFTYYDTYKNLLSYKNKKLVDSRNDNLLYESDGYKYINIENDFLIFFDENRVNIFKSTYKEPR